ncbi:C1-like protein, partial [Cynara cardunculus var. scolymus]
MDEINHFMHQKHSLKFIENLEVIVGIGDDNNDKKGIVHCHGCQEPISDGSAYGCISCQYFLHKKCRELRRVINHHIHSLHPLMLVDHGDLEWTCDVCRKESLVGGFSYYCMQCNFDACTNCDTLPILSVPLMQSNHLFQGTSVAEEHVNDVLQFPMSYAFTDPLKLLHLEKLSLDDDGEAKINHWSHDHPLILNVEPGGNNITNIGCSDPIEVCHGCVRPLSLPYYSCKDGCLFTLHKYCVELPLTLDHQLHPDHSLDLVDTYKDEDYYICNGCFCNGNRFVYTCETCKFCLDVNCAFLPNTIKHISDKHPLIQVIDPITRCKACYKLFDGISFACKSCKFRLDVFCALWSPRFLSHRYCKGHEIPLTYPPVEDHPEDFYCDICEEEMHPKRPQYHCHECKNSFHLKCINRIDCYANVKEEGTITVSYHRHPLTFVRREKTS